MGEIDLIMRDQDCLVFVEVKQRKHSRFGTPLEMVSLQKQHKLRRSVAHYLNHHHLVEHRQALRFDAVGITADQTSTAWQDSVEWVQNAF
jgi:putative endonuclease